jgi:hypothetical protein
MSTKTRPGLTHTHTHTRARVRAPTLEIQLLVTLELVLPHLVCNFAQLGAAECAKHFYLGQKDSQVVDACDLAADAHGAHVGGSVDEDEVARGASDHSGCVSTSTMNTHMSIRTNAD